MGKRPRPSADGISELALKLTDLRAHFEAQLRTVGRAEHFLAKCGRTPDAAAFAPVAAALRHEVREIAEHRRGIQSLLAQIIADAEALRSTD
jgi:hypothetical protein